MKWNNRWTQIWWRSASLILAEPHNVLFLSPSRYLLLIFSISSYSTFFYFSVKLYFILFSLIHTFHFCTLFHSALPLSVSISHALFSFILKIPWFLPFTIPSSLASFLPLFFCFLPYPTRALQCYESRRKPLSLVSSAVPFAAQYNHQQHNTFCLLECSSSRLFTASFCIGGLVPFNPIIDHRLECAFCDTNPYDWKGQTTIYHVIGIIRYQLLLWYFCCL